MPPRPPTKGPQDLMDLLDDRFVVVVPKLAVLLGLNKSIIVRQLHFWIVKLGRDYLDDGRQWIYNTYQQWHENFPWIENVGSVRKHFYDLRDAFLSDDAGDQSDAAAKRRKYRLPRPAGLAPNVSGIILIEGFPGQASSNSRQGKLFTLDYVGLRALHDSAPEYRHTPRAVKVVEAAFAENGLFADLPPRNSPPKMGEQNVHPPAGSDEAEPDLGVQKMHPLGARRLYPNLAVGVQKLHPGCTKVTPNGTSDNISISKITTKETAADAQVGASAEVLGARPDAASAAAVSLGEESKKGDKGPTQDPREAKPAPSNLSEPSPAELGEARRAAMILIQASFEEEDAEKLAAQLNVTAEQAKEAVEHCTCLRDAGKLTGTFRGCVVDRCRNKYPAQPTKGRPRPVPESRQRELDAEQAREAAEADRELLALASLSPTELDRARATAIAAIPNAAGREKCEAISSADLLAGKAKGFRSLVVRAACEIQELAALAAIPPEVFFLAVRTAIETAPNDLVRATFVSVGVADLLAGKSPTFRAAVLSAARLIENSPPIHRPP